MKTNYTVLNKTKQTESFGKKAQLLQLDVHKQVEMLNELYKGKVVFEYTESEDSKGITIKDIEKNVISIELPEIDGYNIKDLINFDLIFSHAHKRTDLVSIKMPKCLKKLEISSSYYWMKYMHRIFVWDTTEVTFDVDRCITSNMGSLEMVAILSSSGGKNKIIKLR